VSLKDVVRNVKATAVVGYTATRGLFDAELLGLLAENTERPVVLALSNPTDRSECTAEEAVRFTGGKALVATGSPFPMVHWKGREVAASQCNNLYVFPGIGLGALVSRASKVTDRMFVRAARALVAMVTPEELEKGLLLPRMEQIREVAFAVAREVALEARDSGLGRLLEDGEIDALVRRAMWDARIFPYRPGTLR